MIGWTWPSAVSFGLNVTFRSAPPPVSSVGSITIGSTSSSGVSLYARGENVSPAIIAKPPPFSTNFRMFSKILLLTDGSAAK